MNMYEGSIKQQSMFKCISISIKVWQQAGSKMLRKIEKKEKGGR